MDKQVIEGDRLYLIAENQAKDFSLFPKSDTTEPLPGLIGALEISRRTSQLANLDIDSYIEAVVNPAEDPSRVSAPAVLEQLGRLVEEESEGPFYSAIIELQFDGAPRLVGFIAQNRSVKNGVWMPEHHLMAAHRLEVYAKRRLPVVTLMDTPGADAGEEANRNNQAHSISRLIAEMSNLDVPNVGIVFGLGYSGGAIPLAASNMILSVRDGVFSTIQPRALANIARRLNLSWQECAKYVGLSPFELYAQGNIDGIIDYSPGETGLNLDNFRNAIIAGIQRIENRSREFVSEHPYIMEHYQQSLQRFLNPSPHLQILQDSAALKITKNPTEYLNVFGVTYRYLRYLKVRQRIHATTIQQYGRLADQEIPAGELRERADLERRQTFLQWLQDPDRVVYDDGLSKAWKSYSEKKQALGDQRGRIAQLLFGEPKKNFEDARANLLATVGTFLYNRWKTEAVGNLRAMLEFLDHHEDTRQILRVSDLREPRKFLKVLAKDELMFEHLHSCFTYEGKKLLRGRGIADKSEAFLANQLTSELNLVVTGADLVPVLAGAVSENAATLHNRGASDITVNRAVLQDRYAQFMSRKVVSEIPVSLNELTILDILISDDLREDFVLECENLLLFDSVFDQIIANLDSIAEEAHESQSLAKSSLTKLLDTTLDLATQGLTLGTSSTAQKMQKDSATLGEQFFDWYLRVMRMQKSSDFYRTVEEWKKTSFPHLSDTLFVVVTHLFESLLASFIQSEKEGKAYHGRIAPRNIGRRKDFWNRLDIAYRDLLMQNMLRDQKNKSKFGFQNFIDEFFTDFEFKYEDLLSSDPRSFPGFRLSIENALKKKVPPCGVLAGIGTFNDGQIGEDGKTGTPMGVLISNVDFQAGSFDMASAEKFCRLLVECAEQHLPLVCFISSGGMQTKEGAGALFSMAAVNDRITRFIRDHDLPIIVFGFGDCTGGAQASFVTHPLVQTYYFSGTSMPFAGQIVVPSNLPLNSLLSNYLSLTKGAMQGLVKHPFMPELDAELRRIDEEIPLPQDSVVDVIKRITSGSLTQERPVVVAHRPNFTDKDLVRPIRRVLIHARGCTAAKLIRIAQRLDIEVVLVQSDPDMESAAVDQLLPRDTLVCIGGNTPDESYLNAMSVVNVAERERVDALHPGIGFLSENSQFAELVRSHGINLIGPPVSSMETMGNKSNAISTAMSLGVPVVPGSHGIVADVEQAAVVAERIGYPLLIKAVHGGGGKGIQVVEYPRQFHELFHRVTIEARSAFGNGDVYLEKYVTSLRHIEAQLLRDTHGNTKVLGIRDCSVQRDKQKVIEESDSTMLTPELRKAVLEHTASLADKVGYVGAGTVEFIYDLDSDAIYFMEMNTRLQVEHPVTEWVSGVDIVGEQFRIASGESIASLDVKKQGYAIEARINAERVQQDAEGHLLFRPHPGQIVAWELPEEEEVEIIAAGAAEKFISPYYDSMVAQIIVHAADRPAAIAKLDKYLSRVRISGICTNIPLLRRVLQDDVFAKGIYDTGYLPALFERLDKAALIDEIEAGAGDSAVGIDRETIAIDDSSELRVLAPATAIFYTTPTPSDPDYVAIGDQIDVDTTLCQLEAMKIFSPLRLMDFNGEAVLYDPAIKYEVTRINMSNGQQVNAGDLLFVVQPAIN